MIIVKGKELEFSFMNADHVQKWENARKEVQLRYADLSGADPSDLQEYADLLRRACESIHELFDGIFGDGTSNELFGASCDFEECFDVYAEFEDAVVDQSVKAANKVSKRYVPDTSRRAGKKK